jgi:hypothetical protein
VERMGVGARGRLDSLTVGDVEDFLAGCEGYRARMPGSHGQGRAEAAGCLLQYIEELAAGRCRRRQPSVSRARNRALTHCAPP